MDKKTRTLEYYRRLPYSLRTEPARDSDGNQYWLAEYLELRGCKIDGTTEAEAVQNLHELFDEYISARLEVGDEIPEPAKLKETVEALWIIIPRTKLSIADSEAVVEETKRTEGEYEVIAA
ncbi:MAG TPA: type II toxin-antitoxin system HicB family antitoxin [Bacteroidota bacterium]|nr:type II toxin-antitoxin system HicB family antitoxin [Bacteroidota bacterium]